MPAASPWKDYGKGDVIEFDCRDNARNMQGKGLFVIARILKEKGIEYAEGQHLGASEPYYHWWADVDNAGSGAAAVGGTFAMHLCADGPRGCKAASAKDRVTLHCRQFQPVERDQIAEVITEYSGAGGGPLGLAKLNLLELAPARGRRVLGDPPIGAPAGYGSSLPLVVLVASVSSA